MELTQTPVQSRQMRVLLVSVVLTFIAMTEGAFAQGEESSACYERHPTYEAWQGWGWWWGNRPWTHDVPVEQSRQRWNDYWTLWGETGRGLPNHNINLSVWGPSAGQGCWEYVVRWLDEARAYGDIIVPVTPYRGQADPAYIVFHAGMPPDIVERVIRQYFTWMDRLPPEEVEAAVASFRAMPQGGG